jgi:hypothetical protein
MPIEVLPEEVAVVASGTLVTTAEDPFSAPAVPVGTFCSVSGAEETDGAGTAASEAGCEGADGVVAAAVRGG